MLPLQAENIKKYGKIHLIEISGVKAVQLSNPADLETVLRNEPKNPQRPNFPILEYYREKREKKPGLFFANGTVWHNYRSVMSKPMLRPVEVADYSSEFNEIVSAFCDRVKNIRECPRENMKSRDWTTSFSNGPSSRLQKWCLTNDLGV